MPYTKEIIKPGDGKTKPKYGSMCTVHYVGTLLNGKEFDSSIKKKKPFTFKIGVQQVIKAWDEGVLTMTLGEKCKIVADPDTAYGSKV